MHYPSIMDRINYNIGSEAWMAGIAVYGYCYLEYSLEYILVEKK